MKKIKFVYFDVGGVAIKDFSDTNKWEEMWSGAKIGTDKWEKIFERFDVFKDEVTRGRQVDDFLLILKNELKIRMPDNFSILEVMVGMFEKNKGIERIAQDCGKKYRIGLLTNMYPGMLEMIKERELLPKVKWDAIVDSSVVGLRKPDEEIYERAEREAGVKGEEILFIDNMAKNLVMAEKRGWETFLYNSADYEQSNKELREFLG